MDKKEISRILNEIGLILELKGENVFKVRAYYNGARMIELIDEDLEVLIREERLGEVKGIGKALQEKITELVYFGKLDYYEQLRKDIPEGIFEVLKVPGLGPKKTRQLYQELGITSLGELEYACMENRLIGLKGFGLKTQNNILEGIQNFKKYKGKFLISEALNFGYLLLEKINKHPKVIRSSLAGSLRRRKEIVKDIDIVVSIHEHNRDEVMNDLLGLECIEEIVSQGPKKSSVILKSGIGVDIRLVTDQQYPYALHHFTGSKEHNETMRKRARQMGLKINEYGLFDENENLISCKDEKEFFNRLYLQYIPPELRENNGEIEAAEKDALPDLIEEKDLKGIFHNHSTYSDGINTIRDMAVAAKKLGYHFIGISDHSQSAFYANGLKKDEIIEQHKEIEILNQELEGIHLFKGIESDILADGSLDYEDPILEKFDYVIASVHSRFNMSKEEMTQRIIKAVENKHTNILGHPTGRLLLSREAYLIDMEMILKACKIHNVAVEINANPHRLDLDWRFCKMAKKMGVNIAIEPDAHRVDGLQHVLYGLGIARKGWLEAQDIINTFTLSEIQDFFRK